MSTADRNPQAGAGRTLPKKEADLFKNVVKHYELKQYKKAIKQADGILKRFPNHGETLAMKGLTFNYMNKSDEAHELVKQGLMNDMRSYVCWHVYGLLHRSDHNYNEAIKAYKQALKIDPDNIQILRDLSMLQIQMRDLEGFTITRYSLMSNKPNLKINWMAFALAKHLTGDLRGAVQVIDIYLGTLTEGSAELGRCFESSELALYKNSILAEIPDNYKEALDHLNACEGIVVDRGAWLMMRAQYQLGLGDFAAARNTLLVMMERGMTENYSVHSLYMCALLELDHTIAEQTLRLKGTQTLATMMVLSDEQKTTIREAYEHELAPKFKFSHAVQRIPTSLLVGESLRAALDQRCRKDLTKGVPSLCSELRSYLWVERNGRFERPTDPVDVKLHPVFAIIVDLMDGYIASLQNGCKLAVDTEEEEPPSTILWAWYTRAGLHELCGEYLEGITLLNQCLEHTPTAVDVYELKARLLKVSGDMPAAVECVDAGRDMDRQDRYINNQTTKYMLQNGMEAEALKRIALFTRHEGNPEQNLYDMQCSWYELELAACLARKPEWGPSLRKYAAIVKHFDDFNEDQFDFHAYCLRKVTLRSYVNVLRYEDEIYGHEYYCEAAAGIIRIYLHLYDTPEKSDEKEPDYSQMTASERNKAKAIARKKKKLVDKKDKTPTEHAENGHAKKHNQKSGKPHPIEEDPHGKELVEKDPLEQAKMYSAMLVQYAPKHVETWILRYDVAIRRKKALMALQALHKATAIDEDNSELFSRVVDFAEKRKCFTNTSSEICEVMDVGLMQLISGQSIGDYVKDAYRRASDDPMTSLPRRCAVAQAMAATKVATVLEAAALIVRDGLNARQVTVESCRAANETLHKLGDEVSDERKKWAALVAERFPLMPKLS